MLKTIHVCNHSGAAAWWGQRVALSAPRPAAQLCVETVKIPFRPLNADGDATARHLYHTRLERRERRSNPSAH